MDLIQASCTAAEWCGVGLFETFGHANSYGWRGWRISLF